jgi:hypothetical protein
MLTVRRKKGAAAITAFSLGDWPTIQFIGDGPFEIPVALWASLEDYFELNVADNVATYDSEE